MFDKRKEKTELANTASEPASGTKNFNRGGTAMIGPSIVVNGTITGEENLVVEGTVEGTIDLPKNDLTIGESGRVTANLSAKVIRVDGLVKGDITGGENVVISDTGRVQGNIVAPRVTLQDGAKFKGSIDMDPGSGKAQPTPNKTDNPSERADANQSSQDAG